MDPRLSALLAAVVIFRSFESTNSSIAIGQPHVSDMIPTAPTIKTVNQKDEKLCAIECAKTKPCLSFSFGFNECSMWDTKYIIQDQLLKNMTGHTYYHFNQKPEATEIKLFGERATYDEATKACQKLKRGSLLSIHDHNMQRRLEEEMTKQNYGHIDSVWIGMNGTVDVTGPRTVHGACLKFDLRWADGHIFTAGRFTRFISADPNFPGTTCIALNRAGWGFLPKFGWADAPCSSQYYYVCQFVPSL